MAQDYEITSFRAPVELHIDYERDLNPEQYAAVTATPGPALVLAGAGAGKTRTLIYRVAYLLEQGIPAERILLLTFTNKAAREMMRRVSELLEGGGQAIWGGTFHSVGNRLLRRHADALGYHPDFSILDSDDAKHLIGACLTESDLKKADKHFPKTEVLASIFSLGINTCVPVQNVLEKRFPYFCQYGEEIKKLHHLYQERKKASNAMDYDDLLDLWLKLLQSRKDLCERYQRQFQFILVDEYQDTNQIQGEIVDLLGARHHNIMAVGDDSQSIYSWRGANFRNILDFPNKHPGSKMYKIEKNYRSTPEILELANQAISANVNQFPKELAAVRKSGAKPVLVKCEDAFQQAQFVARRILELRASGVPLGEIAVLYRAHFHAMELQMEFVRQQIPMAITSGVRFFEQAHIKDVVAWLKLVANPRDELAFKRILQQLPGVGPKAADKLWHCFQTSVVSKPLEIGTAGAQPAVKDNGARNAKDAAPAKDLSPMAQRVANCASAIPKKAQSEWLAIATTLLELANPEICRTPGVMIEKVLDSGYTDYLKVTFENSELRLEDIRQLIEFSRKYCNLSEFLAELSLQTNVEAQENTQKVEEKDKVRLSTIHQAKGLEYHAVFVIMLCDGMFPSAKSQESPELEEEERRLFYVAITRARNELYLCYPEFRESRGYQDGFQLPSRFLSEIRGKNLEKWSPEKA
jgi:DNA helicase-2/ATP-dependent DNA helicase PcrA